MKKQKNLSFTQGSILALTLLSLALGGTTQFPPQTLIAALVAFLILFAPPRQSAGLFPNLLFILLLMLSLAAFLPAAWFSTPPWRQHLVNDLQAVLPYSRTGQPWLTLQSCCLLFVGLTWAAYLLGQNWTTSQRFQAVYVLVVGLSILATLAVAAFILRFKVPGWTQQENRGWFPNRNQTADVVALVGLLDYALVIDCLRKKKRAGFFWLTLLVPFGAALVVCYSRAGILMFFGGILLWHLWPTRHHKSAKLTTLSISLVFTLLTLFLLFGGETLDRFMHPAANTTPSASILAAEFRVPIQEDALRFSLESPGFGIGLGNFEALFAAARQASVIQSRALHPESDWLWAACELGWVAPLLFLLWIGWWWNECLPFEAKRGESLRRAITLAVVLFLVHSLVDVSGHRVGSMWFALILASLALPSPREHGEEVVSPPARSFAPLVFRVLAILLLLIVGWWSASLFAASDAFPWLPPTTATLDRLKNSISQMVAERQVDAVDKLCTASINIAPLDWSLYFHRAYAEVFLPGKLSLAVSDFQLARALEPNWVQICLDEGSIWLAANQPDECMDAWQEALRRDPENRSYYYLGMLREAKDNPLVREDLAELGQKNLDYLLVFLNEGTVDEARKTLAQLLASDPTLSSLTAEQRALVFANWWQKGDQADLAARLLNSNDWLATGWPWLAQAYARQNDFQQAWETIASHAKPPTIPDVAPSQSIDELEREFYGRPDNTAIGIMLALAEIKEGRTDDALAAVRALEKVPDHPSYVFYLEAKLWADKQQWELAWNAWQQFDGK